MISVWGSQAAGIMPVTAGFRRSALATRLVVLLVASAAASPGSSPAFAADARPDASASPGTRAVTDSGASAHISDAPTPGASSGAAATAEPTAAAGHGHGTSHNPDFTSLLFVLMLSTMIGLGVITRVSRLLHTPLMSLTNAISAIAVVGAILVTGGNHGLVITILGAIALFASTTNIVSGFMITDRMLKMFKQREPQKP